MFDQTSDAMGVNVYRQAQARPAGALSGQPSAQEQFQFQQQQALHRQHQQQQHDALASLGAQQQIPPDYARQLALRQQQQQQQQANLLQQQHQQQANAAAQQHLSHQQQPGQQQRLVSGGGNPFMQQPQQQHRLQQAAANQQTQLNAMTMGVLPGFPVGGGQSGVPGTAGIRPVTGNTAGNPGGLNMGMMNVGSGLGALGGMSMNIPAAARQSPQGQGGGGAGGIMGGLAGNPANAMASQRAMVANASMFGGMNPAAFNPSMNIGPSGVQGGMMGPGSGSQQLPQGVHPNQALTQQQLLQQHQAQQAQQQAQHQHQQAAGQARPESRTAVGVFQPPNNPSPGRPPSRSQQQQLLLQHQNATRMMGTMGQMNGAGVGVMGHFSAGSPARQDTGSAVGTPVTNPGGASGFPQPHMSALGIGHSSAPGQMPPPGAQAQGQPMISQGRPASTTQQLPQGGPQGQQQGQPSFGPNTVGRVPTPQAGMAGGMTSQQQHQRNMSMQGMMGANPSQQQQLQGQQQQFNAAQQHGVPGQASAPGNLVPTPSQQAQRVDAYSSNPPPPGPGNLNPAALENQPIPGSAPFMGIGALMGGPQQQPPSNGPSPTGSMGIMSPTISQSQMRQATPQQQPAMGMNPGLGRGPMPNQQHGAMPPPRPGAQRGLPQQQPPPPQQRPPTPSTVRGSLPPQGRITPQQQPQRTASAAMVRGASMTADSVASASPSVGGATLGATAGTPGAPNRGLMTTAQFRMASLAHNGSGQGVIRMLEFSNAMATGKDRSLDYWEGVTSDFFVPNKGCMRMTLWKDDNEAKPFEVYSPTLPRFFFSSFCSGVVSIHLTLNGIRETSPAPGEGIVECTYASFTYTFETGYIVVLTGPLRAHILLVPNTGPPAPPGDHSSPSSQPGNSAGGHSLKFSYIEFSSKRISKSIDLSAIKGQRTLYPPPSNDEGSPLAHGTPAMPNGFYHPTNESHMNGLHGAGQDGRNSSGSGASGSPTIVNAGSQAASTVGTAMSGVIEKVIIIDRAIIPPDPVNGFGITESTMRVLELAESVTQLGDLIHLSWDHQLGPLQSLHQYAETMRNLHPEELAARESVIAQATVRAAHADPLEFIPQHFADGQMPRQGMMMSNGMGTITAGPMTASPGMLHTNMPPHQSQMMGGMNPLGQSMHGMPPPQPMDAQMHTPGAATPLMHHSLPNTTQSPSLRPGSSSGPGSQQQGQQSTPVQNFAIPQNVAMGANTSKRKATIDGGPPGSSAGGGNEQGPPPRRQRTAGSGNTGATGAGFDAGPASPTEPGMNTRARGRKSPVATKAPALPKNKGRRGTGA